MSKEFHNSECGQALVLTCIGLMVLMLMAGIGIDVAYLRYEKQQMQKAADAAAIGAASSMITKSNWRQAGIYDAQANGFENGKNGIVVNIYSPPQTVGDPYTGKDGYVEAIVGQAQPLFFLKLLGQNQTMVRSRAIANSNGSSSGCIYAMDPTSAQTFLMEGAVKISANCGILVDSSSEDALHQNGASALIVDNSIGIVGDYTGSGFLPKLPTTGIAPFDDPLRNTDAPTYTGGCDRINYTITSNTPVTLSQGNYCGGITIRSNATVSFLPGQYNLIGGGMTVTGTPQLIGTGVLFYNTYNNTYAAAPINIGGGSATNLSASLSGPLAGILFFQDRTIPVDSMTNMFNGSNGAIFTGALYFPTTNVRYSGNPGALGDNGIIVGWHLDFNGNVNLRDTNLTSNGSPIHSGVLVE